MSRIGPLLLGVLCCAWWVSSASAGPIPVPPLTPPVSGESDLTSFVVGPASQINIDWWVIPTIGTPFPAGNYAYLYQIENTSTVGLDAFSVTLSPGTAAGLLGAGVLAGDDIDLATLYHPAHIVPGEEDPFPFTPLSSVLTSVDTIDDTVTWTFSPLAPGSESDTLFFISPLPPTYGNAVAQDSIPPSPWGTLAVGADLIPIPVPEPGTWALLLIGFFATAMSRAAARRRIRLAR